MASIWSETARLPNFQPLRENIRTDVLIIGGGMAGLLCAKKMQDAGIDYMLVEANTIGTGITKNTTAKLTSQHGLLYHKLINKFGIERAQLYLDANQAALEEYRRLCGGIDCDFSQQDSFVYSTDDRSALEAELAALGKLHFPAELVDTPGLPFPTAGAVKFTHQAQFHPLKFLSARVPMYTIPITPGRNLAVIMEVAAINNRQRKMGYNSAVEFTEQINHHFEQNMGQQV